MKNLVYLILSIFILSGCSNQPVEFHSAGNGLAEIGLVLNSDQTFALEFEVLQEGEEKHVSHGEWISNDNSYELTFSEENTPNLTALFDKRYDNGSIEIVDKRRVKFKKDAKEIVIWGVTCERKLKKPTDNKS